MEDSPQPQVRVPVDSELQEWRVRVAMQLIQAGVSDKVLVDLLVAHPLDLIERQLRYLPYRKAKKPVSLLVAAIQNDYEPPANYPGDASAGV